jgi:hypothetical protein
MFELKPDFEKVLERYEAWWHCEIVDRPLFCLNYLKDYDDHVPWPAPKNYTAIKDRWLDAEHIAENMDATLRNVVFFGDALPITWPNLGPEIFSAFYGCPLSFGESTSWTEPILADWHPESVTELKLSRSNYYFQQLEKLTDALLEKGREKFIVGYTDMHGGGDAVAAFRDPSTLCMDLIDYPQEVKALLHRITTEFLELYDYFHQKLSAAGMPSTTWLGATCHGKYHVPSEDFSALVSDNMFNEFFLDEIVRECQHMDKNIYHLDGPGALRYLDLLLEIPEIHAIQWVAGASRDYWMDWIEVYQRIQKAGKGFWIEIDIGDLNTFMDTFPPKGVWLNISNVGDKDSANAVMKAVEKWR